MNETRPMTYSEMPKTFDPLLSSSDIWIPEAFTADKLADHDNHYLNVMGRLKPGWTIKQAALQ